MGQTFKAAMHVSYSSHIRHECTVVVKLNYGDAPFTHEQKIYSLCCLGLGQVWKVNSPTINLPLIVLIVNWWGWGGDDRNTHRNNSTAVGQDKVRDFGLPCDTSQNSCCTSRLLLQNQRTTTITSLQIKSDMGILKHFKIKGIKRMDS